MGLMNNSSERVVIVTGAARGLGWAITQRLANDGLTVVALDRSEAVIERGAELRSLGLKCTGEQIDIVDYDAVIALVVNVAEQYGRLDGLVNNAGFSLITSEGIGPSIEETSLEDFRRIIDVNLTASFLFCREVLPHMKRGGWGRIVNISSRAGRTAIPGADVAYSAAKAGIFGLTRNLASQAGACAITVNAIAPGRFDTPQAKQSSAGMIDQALANIPLKRLGNADEVAATVSFLMSDGGSYITGAVIDVNGGAFMG
jgi:3-oxoacyl-[acyl-carrier protein] reductase